MGGQLPGNRHKKTTALQWQEPPESVCVRINTAYCEREINGSSGTKGPDRRLLHKFLFGNILGGCGLLQSDVKSRAH